MPFGQVDNWVHVNVPNYFPPHGYPLLPWVEIVLLQGIFAYRGYCFSHALEAGVDKGMNILPGLVLVSRIYFIIDLLIHVGWGFSCQHSKYIFGVMLSPVGIVRNDIL